MGLYMLYPIEKLLNASCLGDHSYAVTFNFEFMLQEISFFRKDFVNLGYGVTRYLKITFERRVSSARSFRHKRVYQGLTRMCQHSRCKRVRQLLGQFPNVLGHRRKVLMPMIPLRFLLS